MSVGASMRCPHGKRWTDAELSYLEAHKDDALCDIDVDSLKIEKHGAIAQQRVCDLTGIVD